MNGFYLLDKNQKENRKYIYNKEGNMNENIISKLGVYDTVVDDGKGGLKEETDVMDKEPRLAE